ncbi:hypothetical protein KVT40_007777 [Elsinoe batatas]|uniref:Uncharacterized protein n=1 Tax=Elsinoe batatas TaxID=2601811 RepID=A0A8K0KWR9_9PEZI|nr:hypothetical protein KVT40_007777 [Elsinoe batatas]
MSRIPNAILSSRRTHNFFYTYQVLSSFIFEVLYHCHPRPHPPNYYQQAATVLPASRISYQQANPAHQIHVVPTMCRTIYLAYDCGCQVKKRLSVCRGTFGCEKTGFDDAGRPYTDTRVYCHGNFGMIFPQHKLCAVCAAQSDITQRYQDQDALQAMIDNFTHSLEVMIELEVPEVETIKRIEERLDQAQQVLRHLKDTDFEFGTELLKKYPVPWPDEQTPLRRPVKSPKLNGGSLLRVEVKPEDVVEPDDQEIIDLGPNDGGTTFAESLQAYVERNTAVSYPDREPLEEDIDETVQQEGEYWDYGSAIASEEAGWASWYATHEGTESDHDQTEYFDEGVTSTEHLNGERTTRAYHTSGKDKEGQGLATISPSQTLTLRNRPVTPEAERLQASEGLMFKSPIKDLAAGLYIPTGSVKSLQLIGKFSFEQLPVLPASDPPSPLDILSNNDPIDPPHSTSENDDSKYPSKIPTPRGKKMTIKKTRSYQQSVQGKVDLEQHRNNAHHYQGHYNTDNYTEDADDAMIRRDSGCVLDDSALEESQGYWGVGYWNWTSTGT